VTGSGNLAVQGVRLFKENGDLGACRGTPPQTENCRRERKAEALSKLWSMLHN
jgi:hypothetical protein